MPSNVDIIHINNLEVSSFLGTSYKDSIEYVRIITDSSNHILCGIKENGDVYFGAGVPQQVIDYVYEHADMILDDKVDKEEGKSLIDNNYIQEISNPEYLNAVIDSEGRILNAITTNGEEIVGGVNINKLDENVNDIKDTVEDIKPISDYFYDDNDIENRLEIKTDLNGKILSYIKSDGTEVVEKIELKDVVYSKDAENQIKDIASSAIDANIQYKGQHLPKYGTVNIIQETFYLTADNRYSDKTGVYLIQDYPDTDLNATDKITLSYFYIKSTLTDNGDGTYSENPNSVRLDFYAASKVTKVGNDYYVTSTLTEVEDSSTGEISYEVNSESIQVTQIVDIPPYKAWPIDKKTEHYCVVEIDFDYFLSGTFNIGVKYQGSSTLLKRKRNFRFTFYKNNTYSKKDKIKIGEFIRQSGFNLKANWNDSTRIMELVLYRLITLIWELRDIYDQYPWNKDNTPYTGATGIIKGFPIRVSVGGEFYGLDIFSLKKDEKNYMLDGQETGIFYSGKGNSNESWIPDAETYWEDEMNDEMYQDDIDAVNALLTFINDDTEFTRENVPQKMGIISWIDYFICMEVFIMFDSTHRNVILYSGADKEKFYPFFYDLDFSWGISYPYDIEFYQYSIETLGRVLEPWVKIRDIYWEEIVNRYCKLRDTVLNIANLIAIYKDVIEEIPEEDFVNEGERWGGNYSSDAFEGHLEWIENRFEWLDENYFKI